MQSLVERPTAPINVAIDGFIADAVAARSPGQASGNLLRRPSLGEALQDFLAKLGLTLELVGSAAGMATQGRTSPGRGHKDGNAANTSK